MMSIRLTFPTEPRPLYGNGCSAVTGGVLFFRCDREFHAVELIRELDLAGQAGLFLAVALGLFQQFQLIILGSLKLGESGFFELIRGIGSTMGFKADNNYSRNESVLGRKTDADTFDRALNRDSVSKNEKSIWP